MRPAGHPASLICAPALAADLVRRRVPVIFTVSDPYIALATKAATATIPIVFTSVMTRPTWPRLQPQQARRQYQGVSYFVGELVPKPLELLHELVLQATTIEL